MKKNVNNCLRVVTKTQEDTAEMYLYGYIGQDFSWWDPERVEENLTDLALVSTLKDLEKDYSRINIRINSPGGSVYHGDPFISAIRQSSREIHTYNDGMAASMAADIWGAAPNRHMPGNAKLMIHATSGGLFGTARELREEADILDIYDDGAIFTLAASTGKTEDEIRKMFYADYADHWLSAKKAKELGLIDKIEDYPTQQLPANAEKMNYRQLVEYYLPEKQERNKLFSTLLGLAQEAFQPNKISKTKKTVTVSIEEFKTGIEDGSLEVDAIKAYLTEKGHLKTETPDPPPAKPQKIEAERIAEAVKTALEPYDTKIVELTKQVKALGDVPGEGPALGESDGDSYEGLSADEVKAKKGLEAFDKALAKEASGSNMVFTDQKR